MEEVLPNINGTISDLRRAGIPVIFTQQGGRWSFSTPLMTPSFPASPAELFSPASLSCQASRTLRQRRRRASLLGR